MKVFKTILITAFLICFTIPASFGDAQKLMSVQVKQGHLRATPSFLGRIVARLAYGDRVQVYEEKSSWARVSTPEIKAGGWIHVSALSPKKIVLSAGAADIEKAATSDEIALAGKGFNKQVEGEFKSKNHLDYTWIDKMEQMVVSQARIKAFVKEGDLSPEGGFK
jgi:SH3-like domain-containing protein